MPFAELDEVTIEYDRRGDPDGPTVLMIMGLGAQRIWWPDELLDALAGEGFDVVSFDNRDAGRSTILDDRPGSPADIYRRYAGERDVPVPYTLRDMADDAVGLLDHLGVERAHVVGASMGGMIAQHVALHHPERTISLTSIMSSTGSREVGQATPEALAALMEAAPTEREAYLEHSVATAKVLASPTLFDEERTRARAAAAFDRGYHPRGTVRQFLAILADGDRTERLRRLRVPTLVVHGADDPLIMPDGGAATAEAIADAKLVLVPEMAHDLPLPLIDELVATIGDHLRRSDDGGAAR